MAKFMFTGLDEYEEQLAQLASEDSVKSVCGAAIYAGADEVANAVRESIQAIPTVDYRKHGTGQQKLSGITSEQKKGLLDGFGITPMSRTDGYYNVKLGFDGYNGVRTKKYPSGQPNSMIARSVDSGTSFRQKIPFMKTAVRQSKPKALDAMSRAFDDEMKKQIK